MNVRHYNAAFSTSSWSEICSIMRKMRQLELLPDAVTHSSCLTAAGKTASWPLATQCISLMSLCNVGPDAISLNSFAAACATGSKWQLALLNTRGVSSDSIGCTNLISSCKGDRWRTSLNILQDMPFDNHICHNACLDACEKGEQWGISLRLLISMPLRQLLLDAIGWTSVISACQHHLAWKSAVHSLGLMRATGASPNVQSCGAAIASCRERWADAVDLCRGLAASRALNAVASNAVLSSLAISAVSSGDWRRAFGALGAFASRGLVRAKANGLNACLASLAVGSWPVALQTLRVLRARAGVDTFGPVVSSLEKSIKWREAFHVSHQMACRSVRADIACCNSIVSACAQESNWKYAVNIFGGIRFCRLSSDFITHNSVMTCCGGAHRWQAALGLLDHDRAPDRVACSVMVASCVQSFAWLAGLSLLSWHILGDTGAACAIATTASLEGCSASQAWPKVPPLLCHLGASAYTAISVAFKKGCIAWVFEVEIKDFVWLEVMLSPCKRDPPASDNIICA